MNRWVTLLSSDDYLPAVLILNQNLQDINSKFSLHVIVIDTLSKKTLEYLEKENIEYTLLPPVLYSQETIEKTPSKRLQSIASKINIFQLKQFDKIVYLDADCFFLKNVDELFDYPDGALTDCGDIRGFCGLLVCSPKNHPFNYYKTILQNNYMWESDLIEELWFPFKSNPDYRIPFKYFYTITSRLDQYYPIETQIFGIHFCSTVKPWFYSQLNDYLRDYYKRYPMRDNNREVILKQYYTILNQIKFNYPELYGS